MEIVYFTIKREGGRAMASVDPREWGFVAVTDPLDVAWRRYHAYLQRLGFNNAAFVFDNPNVSEDNPRGTLLGTRVSAEYEDYCSNHRPRSDFGVPDAARCGRTLKVVPERMIRDPAVGQEERQFVRDALDMGLRLGWTTPCADRISRRFSVLLLAESRDTEGFENLVGQVGSSITRATIYFTEGLIVRKLLKAKPKRLPLTLRQEDCLAWVGAGKSTKEISDLLGISESTANEYVQDAMHKLGASNRTQAVARAMLLGAISP